jgi:hypothetical protein
LGYKRYRRRCSMSNFRKEVKTLNFRRLFIALAVLSLVFTFNTCDLPMGLGDPIDWEPPVLTLDPGYPNPLYVRLGTKLAGTVTDNIGVDRVILRNANTGVEMFEAKLLSNNRWEISLDFEPEQNGEKIAVEIVAFDRVGNSGDSSITAITLIIDIRPPIIKDMKISRTAVRDAYLETYHDLFDLERTDPYGPFGTLSANVNKYQNGLFYIKGEVSEDETRIEVLGLSIYDANRDPNTPLLLKPGESRFSLPKPEGSSDYAPIWLVNEEDILNAGDKLWPDYKTNYYENGSRYYYRVAIYAIDRSGNEGESLIIEDEGFFCMWEKGDEPKGIIDRLIGSVVTKGATIPVEFFDDDTLDRAYVGLLTEDQWEGIKEIAPGTIIPQDKDNDGKLEWLRERLLAGGTVYDWKYDKKNGTQQEIVDQIAGKTFDERIIYIQTGNDESDTGIYILFTLTADKKLDPHPPYTGAVETLKPRWKGRFWLVDVIDENAPLIVFDTVNTTDSDYKPAEHSGSEINEPNLNARTGNSPEENTFPKLSEGTDGSGGRYFEINGYTLRAYREDQAVHNSVVKFRMAWIPFGIGGGHPDDYITAVQNALRGTNELSYPNTFNNLPGIQHWEFVPEPGAGQGTFIEGTDEEIGDSKFKKQVFRKRFDVLGGADDLKNVYNNFTYNGSRENETKLFVFYAEDNMGHEVFRQLRLLGNKTPPDLAVYDLTARDGITLPPGLPNLNNGDEEAGKVYFNTSGNIDEEGREEYRTDLKAYQEEGYNAMKPVALSGGNLLLTDADKTEPYQAYPRDTDIKYWVMAEKSGDLAVANSMMQDITFSSDSREVGHYNADDRSLSYVEKLPEVTQRVFLFTATDTLGNVVRIQRTVAVTNAAVLNNITTSTQSGDYGIGEIITLQANFSNLVKWTRPGGDGADNDTNRPKLNVRYQEGGVGGDTVVRSIPTKTPSDTPALFLEFDFVIQQNDTGILETMYYGMSLPAGDDNNKNNRPITIPEGTRILDYSRDDDAFTPRNSPGFDWTASGQGPRNSLQGSLDKPNKTIILDGIRPVITGFTLNPPTEKTLYADAWPGYYYKANETIQFTLTADKPIFTSGDPVVDLQIDSNWYGAAWQRASGTNGMVFSVLVNSANTPDGTITGIRLRDVSKVVDGVGNAFNAGTSTYTLFNRLNPNVTIRIDKTPPTAPGTSLNGEGVGSTTTRYYNQNPTLAISGNTGEGAVPVTTQYSLNNGVTWKEFAPDFESEPTWTSGSPGANLRILNGEWTLVTRYIDRAGNEGVATNIPATNGITTQPLHVNTAFPKLLGVSSVKPNGTYNRGNSLSFTLDFADTVTINNNTNISLTLADMTTTTNNTDGTNPSYQIILSGVNVTLATNGRTLTFTWANVNGKDMLNGLKVTALNLSGLRDRFGNYGPDAASINTATSGTVGMPASGDQAAYSVTYNLTGIIVSGILPTARTFAPVNAAGITGNNFTSAVSADNKTITITFSKPMQRGRGTITVRPHGNYAIPAVFENEGYYLTVDLDSGEEKRYAAKPAGDSTYVSGMNDVYNNMTTANRNYLITGGTLSAPEESLNTGLSAGPYKKMTHGLTQGPGYTGNYNNTTPTAPAAPGREGTTYMVPDTTTKWVLDYQYQIHATTAPVSNIRTALTSIGFRRQEIAVTSTANVAIPSGSSIVTITLSEPLLPGLQWDLFYDVGTFTDLAGNSAAAVAEGTHWFWSRGVQKPVIRVDRKSYDGRAAATVVGGQSSFIHDGSSTTQAYTDTNAYAGNIASFNTVAYRIETETPGARIFYGTQLGTGYTTGGAGSITGAWTGRATLTAGTGLNFSNSLNWNGDKANNVTVGEWVRTNLIFRNYNGNSVSNPQTGTYTVTENGIATTQVVGGPRNADGTQAGGLGNFGTNYYGFRSFNRDATATELESLPLATSGVNNMYASSFDYDNSGLQASKNYVAAQARVDHSGANNYTAITYPTASLRGYEGVFRTVIALNQAAATGGDANYILLCGTNVKSGIPTVAGFPAKDGVANTDTRFIKVFYINNTNQYYWVSTEIVTPWYMQSYRRGNTGGSYLRVGDATDWMTAGYGDLSYAYNVFSW